MNMYIWIYHRYMCVYRYIIGIIYIYMHHHLAFPSLRAEINSQYCGNLGAQGLDTALKTSALGSQSAADMVDRLSFQPVGSPKPHVYIN